jgi:hypothetical protein
MVMFESLMSCTCVVCSDLLSAFAFVLEGRGNSEEEARGLIANVTHVPYLDIQPQLQTLADAQVRNPDPPLVGSGCFEMITSALGGWNRCDFSLLGVWGGGGSHGPRERERTCAPPA